MNANLPDDVLGDALAVSMARVVAAANKRAHELGVDAGQCVISVAQEATGGEPRWRVNYGPKNYVGRRGGDLVIDVNPADYTVAKVLRGQ
jgi:hypothetical protein